MIPAMKLGDVPAVAVAVLGVVACSNRDQEAQKLIDELGRLDETVKATVRDSPNDDGVAKAEALVGAERESLHERVVKMRAASLGPAASQALGNACLKSSMNAKLVKEYVMNAVLKTNPALVARANKLADSLCEICVTGPSDSWMCASFKERPPEN